jgi:hypothetical protein
MEYTLVVIYRTMYAKQLLMVSVEYLLIKRDIDSINAIVIIELDFDMQPTCCYSFMPVEITKAKMMLL